MFSEGSTQIEGMYPHSVQGFAFYPLEQQFWISSHLSVVCFINFLLTSLIEHFLDIVLTMIKFILLIFPFRLSPLTSWSTVNANMNGIENQTRWNIIAKHVFWYVYALLCTSNNIFVSFVFKVLTKLAVKELLNDSYLKFKRIFNVQKSSQAHYFCISLLRTVPGCHTIIDNESVDIHLYFHSFFNVARVKFT